MPRYSSEAYDFSLFEERTSTEERVSNARWKAAAVLCFGVVFSAVTLVVYNQVQLTELTEEINTTAKQLEEAESLEIQLNMEASAQMDGAAVEQYAQEELGMSKVSGGQVTYVNVAQEDQGTVVREATSGSFWENLWSAIQSWFQ